MLEPRIVRVTGDFVRMAYDFKEYLFVVVREGGKFYVKSDDGRKKLAGPYDTREEAQKRLKQIDFFKRLRKGRK